MWDAGWMGRVLELRRQGGAVWGSGRGGGGVGW